MTQCLNDTCESCESHPALPGHFLCEHCQRAFLAGISAEHRRWQKHTGECERCRDCSKSPGRLLPYQQRGLTPAESQIERYFAVVQYEINRAIAEMG